MQKGEGMRQDRELMPSEAVCVHCDGDDLRLIEVVIVKRHLRRIASGHPVVSIEHEIDMDEPVDVYLQCQHCWTEFIAVDVDYE